jgi:hypothetical protein
MAKWLAELEQSLNSDPQPEQVQIKKSHKDEMLISFFLLSVIILFFIIGFMYYQYKHKSTVSATPSVEQLNQGESTPSLVAIQDQVRKIMERNRELNRKVWLLGVLHNENFAELNKLVPTVGFVKIRTDWTADRIPNNIPLSEEDRNALMFKTEQ